MRRWKIWLSVPFGYLLIVFVVPPLAFSQPKDKTASANGAGLYSQHCAVCHGPEGRGKIGPSLQAAHNPQQVVQIVRTGKGVMPSFAKQLSPEEIQALAAYVTQKLAVVSLEGANLSEGGVLYRLNCSPCHRTAVRGGALAFAKTNAPRLTGLSAATIAGAIRSGPGPMPAFPPSVFNDKQLASIVKYVRFMQHPPSPGGFPLNYYGPVAEGLVALLMVGILALVGSWIEGRSRG
jgi:ubiquinol-cytochrome c reductase cytochrome c subunit